MKPSLRRKTRSSVRGIYRYVSTGMREQRTLVLLPAVRVLRSRFQLQAEREARRAALLQKARQRQVLTECLLSCCCCMDLITHNREMHTSNILDCTATKTLLACLVQYWSLSWLLLSDYSVFDFVFLFTAGRAPSNRCGSCCQHTCASRSNTAAARGEAKTCRHFCCSTSAVRGAVTQPKQQRPNAEAH